MQKKWISKVLCKGGLCIALLLMGSRVGLAAELPQTSEETLIAQSTKTQEVWRVSLKEISSDGKSITLKWKKNKEMSGYLIYRRTVNGAWKKIKNIRDFTVNTYTDTTVKQNKEYYYTVKGYYYDENGNRCFSDYDKNGLYADIQPEITYVTVEDKTSVFDGETLQLYFDCAGNLIQDLEPFLGEYAPSDYRLYVDKTNNVVTVCIKTEEYLIPYKAFLCSTGGALTPNGTYQMKEQYRWHELMGPSWGQWCSRITGGILFHSVYYNAENNNRTLSVSAYNKLGTACSHGCVRLTAAAAKWIYDHCATNETEIVVHSQKGYTPFEKPTADTLKSSHTWDPTDPNLSSLCQKNGCH